jgi:hypothetical protein
MGDERGVNSTNPYSWFCGNRPGMLESFLNEYCNRSDVQEVVVLGDLFDEWVCPAEFPPTDPTGQSQAWNIKGALRNKGVIEQLKVIADKTASALSTAIGMTSSMRPSKTAVLLAAIYPGVFHHAHSRRGDPQDRKLNDPFQGRMEMAP